MEIEQAIQTPHAPQTALERAQRARQGVTICFGCRRPVATTPVIRAGCFFHAGCADVREPQQRATTSSIAAREALQRQIDQLRADALRPTPQPSARRRPQLQTGSVAARVALQREIDNEREAERLESEASRAPAGSILQRDLLRRRIQFEQSRPLR